MQHPNGCAKWNAELSMAKRIIVASHRRSGTHLAIDTIANNFNAFSASPYVSLLTLDGLASHVQHKDLSPQQFRRRIHGIDCILKTHSHGFIHEFFDGPAEVSDFAEELFSNAKVIYVHRDGRDVLSSLYHYQKACDRNIKDIPFGKYIRMPNSFDKETYKGDLDKVAFWAFHVSSWMKNNNCLLMSFDDFQGDYSMALNRISDFIDEPLIEKIQDVRRSAKTRIGALREKVRMRVLNNLGGSRHSSVIFRKGISGDWASYFSSEDLAFFCSRAGELNRKLGYK